MEDASKYFEVAKNWENNRWQSFKSCLEKISKTNKFYQKHFPGVKFFDEWKSFEDISAKEAKKLIITLKSK